MSSKASSSPNSSNDRSKIALFTKHQLECMKSPKSIEQGILNRFIASFKQYLTADAEYESALRQIKQHFVKRDYVEIFNDHAGLLQIYSATYAPYRALLFHDFFVRHEELVKALSDSSSVFCLGAGTGAELVGITAALLVCRREKSSESATLTDSTSPIMIHVQDMADYTTCIYQLTNAITSWQLPPAYDTKFSIADVAAPDSEEYMAQHIGEADIITSFFILNEMLQSDKTGFVRLITRFVQNMKTGAIWIVIDSAGSFSLHKLGGGKREYMACTFLDLLAGFTVIAKDDSCWYRFPEGLEYPTPLQNSRYYYRILCKDA